MASREVNRDHRPAATITVAASTVPYEVSMWNGPVPSIVSNLTARPCAHASLLCRLPQECIQVIPRNAEGCGFHTGTHDASIKMHPNLADDRRVAQDYICGRHGTKQVAQHRERFSGDELTTDFVAWEFTRLEQHHADTEPRGSNRRRRACRPGANYCEVKFGAAVLHSPPGPASKSALPCETGSALKLRHVGLEPQSGSCAFLRPCRHVAPRRARRAT